jgi:nitrogen regulatory protein P-II 2
MNLIIAVIKPLKLDEARDSLTRIGVHSMTVNEVKGFGRQKGHMEICRGAEYAVNFLPKVRIEVAIASQQVDQALDVNISAAKTGQIGDGKIFVVPLEQAVRIGETGADAL